MATKLFEVRDHDSPAHSFEARGDVVLEARRCAPPRAASSYSAPSAVRAVAPPLGELAVRGERGGDDATSAPYEGGGG